MSAQPQPRDPSPADDAPRLTLFHGEPASPQGAAPADVDLAELLGAWQTSTTRLEKTHALLRDEVGRLRAELEVKNRELARKNRMADLGEMASHVAHEVRNNLTPVTLYLGLVRRHLAGDADGLEVLAKVEAGFTALEATVNDLLSFSAHRQPHRSDFLVCSLVEEVCESLGPQLEAQGVEVEIDSPPHTTLTADREMVRRAVLNLVLNALDVMPEGGDIVVTVYDGAERLEIEVADSGPGLTDEQRERLFEPFYSTKETGTGLGLSVVAHVADAHGGSASACNCPEGGAALTITFPRRAMGVAA